MRRITDVNLVISELKNGCRRCKSHPLLLTNATQDDSLSVNRLEVVCPNCNEKNYVLLHSVKVEEKMVLGCYTLVKDIATWKLFYQLLGPLDKSGKV